MVTLKVVVVLVYIQTSLNPTPQRKSDDSCSRFNTCCNWWWSVQGTNTTLGGNGGHTTAGVTIGGGGVWWIQKRLGYPFPNPIPSNYNGGVPGPVGGPAPADSNGSGGSWTKR